MKKYTANQPLVLNNTRFDKGATIELTDKQATDMVSAGMISPVLAEAAPTQAPAKANAKPAKESAE
jgi:hypothetical protein